MKTITTLALLTACGSLALSTGCGSNETASAPAPDKAATTATAPAGKSAEAAATTAATAAADTTKQQADAAKMAAEQMAADKLAQMNSAAAQESQRVQGLIDSVKQLSGQNKFAEALKMLAELSKSKLTPDQQAMVDSLKQATEKQAAQAMTDKAGAGAASAIGGALGGKK